MIQKWSRIAILYRQHHFFRPQVVIRRYPHWRLHPPPGISASSGNDKATPPKMPLPLPSLHVTQPSTSSTTPGPRPGAFSAVVEMMDRGDSPGRRRARGQSPGPVEVIEEKQQDSQPPREGRAQIPRRGMMGPGAILGMFPSSSIDHS